MALLDRLIRLDGVTAGQAVFPLIRDLRLQVRVPKAVAVNRTFQRVIRSYDNKTGKWTETISQREFCFHAGSMTMAMELAPEVEARLDLLVRGFSAINYFGRKGSFMQWMGAETSEQAPTPQTGFVNISEPTTQRAALGFLQRMDEMLPTATFDDVSIMNPKAKGGRTSYTVIFPYRLAYHGQNHTIYDTLYMGN
jgi:hypothetical protein